MQVHMQSKRDRYCATVMLQSVSIDGSVAQISCSSLFLCVCVCVCPYIFKPPITTINPLNGEI